MPFTGLVNPQQIEVTVAGPGDVTRLYLCKGLAQGVFGVTVNAGQSSSQTETWQFEVGPQLDVTQFRRAIATVAFAGVGEVEPGEGASASVSVETVTADFNDDVGNVRVSATNRIELYNPGTSGLQFEKVTTLAYDVSILAAVQ